MECDAQPLELRQFLLALRFTYLAIWSLTAKIFEKWSNRWNAATSEIILRQWYKNSVKFIATRIFSNYDGFYILLRYTLTKYHRFIIQNIRIKIKLLKGNNFLLKGIHALLSKDQRNKFSHYFFSLAFQMKISNTRNLSATTFNWE